MTTYTQEQLARIIINTLTERDIKPDAEFTAAAGQDYGDVTAYELPGNMGFAIAYGNNGQTDYDITDTDDDLACWLESPDLDGIDNMLQTANVRGIDQVAEAEAGDEGPLTVLIACSWYGPTETTAQATDDDGHPIEFDTIEEAQAWVDEQESGTYYTSHNESGRPEYKIVCA